MPNTRAAAAVTAPAQPTIRMENILLRRAHGECFAGNRASVIRIRRSARRFDWFNEAGCPRDFSEHFEFFGASLALGDVRGQQGVLSRSQVGVDKAGEQWKYLTADLGPSRGLLDGVSRLSGGSIHLYLSLAASPLAVAPRDGIRRSRPDGPRFAPSPLAEHSIQVEPQSITNLRTFHGNRLPNSHAKNTALSLQSDNPFLKK